MNPKLTSKRRFLFYLGGITCKHLWCSIITALQIFFWEHGLKLWLQGGVGIYFIPTFWTSNYTPLKRKPEFLKRNQKPERTNLFIIGTTETIAHCKPELYRNKDILIFFLNSIAIFFFCKHKWLLKHQEGRVEGSIDQLPAAPFQNKLLGWTANRKPNFSL